MPSDQKQANSTKEASVVKSAGIVGGLTLLSRMMGLIRDALIAALFKRHITDAFILAFTIPNVLRRLVAEGSLTVAFLPVFTDYRKQKSEEEAKVLLSNVLGLLAIVLLLLTALGIWVAPWLVELFGKGLAGSTRLPLAILLTRLMFPFLITVGLVALAMGALNSYRHFGAPAAAPVVLNLGIIGMLICGKGLTQLLTLPPAAILALGVIFGGALQLILQFPWLIRKGLWVPPRFNIRHPGVIRIATLMAPSLFGLAIYQVNILLARRFASFLAAGAISYLYYSQRLIEFPLGIFAVAIATVSLPRLSENASDRDHVALKQTYLHALRLVLLVLIPASLGLIALAIPISSVLFLRGEFSSAMAIQTGYALIGFSFGLISSGIVRQTVPAFFALKDAKTPVVASAIALISYIIFAKILMNKLETLGLAIAVSIASTANAIVLISVLRRRIGALGLTQLLPQFAKTLFSAVLCSAVAYGISLLGDWPLGATIKNMSVLVVSVGIGAALYVSAALLLGVSDMRLLIHGIKRRLKKNT